MNITKEILINIDKQENRVVLLEDGELAEFHIARDERIIGSIYKGRVANVLQGMQAAFVDIGLEKNAFLCLEDAIINVSHEDEDPLEEATEVSIKDVLKPNQELLVQVIKEPIGTKGARVSTHITLPGRFLVLLPMANYIGVSRRIENPVERERLKEVAAKIKPDNIGVIIRTVAEGKSEEVFTQDLNFLLKLWKKIKQKTNKTYAPSCIHHDLSLVYKSIRDMLDSSVERVIIDSKDEYKKVRELAGVISPNLKSRIKYYSGKRALFDIYGLEKKIDEITKSKVWLESGGYIIIEKTEALTVIDVNTGKYVGGTSLEDTILQTNLEAVKKIASQIRLRDIGGIIIIDFIDMELPANREAVLKSLNEQVKRDRTRTTVVEMTGLGLVEITRKRISQDLDNVLKEPCPYCKGEGKLLSPKTISIRLEREIKKQCLENHGDAIKIIVNPEVGLLITGWDGERIQELERTVDKKIYLYVNEYQHIKKYNLAFGPIQKMAGEFPDLKEGEEVEIEIKDSHPLNFQNGISWIKGHIIEVNSGGNLIGKTVKVKITEISPHFSKANLS